MGGDYLHRTAGDFDTTPTTWSECPGDVWILVQLDNGNVLVKSWKGDFLCRCDQGQGVILSKTPYATGTEWTIQSAPDGTAKLWSPSGNDWLHRGAGGERGVTTYNQDAPGDYWTLVDVAPIPDVDLPQYRICPRCKGPARQTLYLTAAPGSINEVVVRVFTNRDDPHQLWIREEDEQGKFLLFNVGSNTYICTRHCNDDKDLLYLGSKDNARRWERTDNVIRYANIDPEDDANLNVSGDGPYTDGNVVIVWKAGYDNNPNEHWDWHRYITCPPGTLSLLTFNTHLFAGSLAGEVRRLISDALMKLDVSPGQLVAKAIDRWIKNCVFEEDWRRDAILEKVTGFGPDIICLQEVWGDDFRRGIVAALTARGWSYSYCYPAQAVSQADVQDVVQCLMDLVIPEDLISHLPGPIRKPAREILLALKVELSQGLLQLIRAGGAPPFTNGIIVVSRHPLANCNYAAYDSMKELPDRIGKKGYVTFDVDVPIPNSERKRIRFGTTHAPCDSEDAYAGLKRAADSVFGTAPQDGILMGDFNLHYYNKPTERDQLKTIMTGYKASEMVELRLPMRDDCYTDWPYGNKLTDALGDKPETDKGKDRIDYVYFSPAADPAMRILDPETVCVVVPQDWKMVCDDKGCDDDYQPLEMSDHNPVYCRFAFVKK